MSYTTEWPLSTFPISPSIPPTNFFNINQGLATWLNQNPTYKQYFVGYDNYFPNLFKSNYIQDLVCTSQLPPDSIYLNYNIENVPLQPYVINLSQYQSQKYREQFDIFLRVYAYNSNAYVNYRNNITTNPLYYRFIDYNEYNNYKAGVSLVNKMYPFQMMANGVNEVGSTLNWVIPFPL